MNTAKKAALVLAAAGVAAGASAGSAFAQSGAQGQTANSPGVGSGNLVQAPVHVPANVTGNSVNVVGVLNPAFGNLTHNS
ncbi:chaplin [Streptomyces qinglanensis]|uniref:Small secreted domain n=1 Tax=Streptomyces qinglanensis TaxID=943816 RepID=A0A1H9N162_9ACTN|nr:chaplin [Streptomyces qinglanensis]SER29684.1 Small secreted domain [Streptomyces qinglanensis]